jgi:predicted enzyme related to lactoylglutathione lyase
MTGSDQPRTYPPGVPCWVDTSPPDPAAAARFYGELFGWRFQDADGGRYLVATLDGAGFTVSEIGPPA